MGKQGTDSQLETIGNPALKSVKRGFKGNEIIDGVFQNLDGQSGGSSLWNVLKWRFSKNAQRKIKKREKYVLPVTSAKQVLQDRDNYILWLGHASWLIQIDGKEGFIEGDGGRCFSVIYAWVSLILSCFFLSVPDPGKRLLIT